MNAKNKTEIEKAFDRVAQELMVMPFVLSKYTEWQVLDRRMFRAMADQTVPFSDEDRNRMDALSRDIMAIVFRVVEEMRERKMDVSGLWGFFFPSRIAGASAAG